LSSASARVRVMTWNIHGGVGPDGRFDLGRVVKAITYHDPDVVALQEVDSRRTVAPARSAFAVLREAVGHHGVEAKSIITADGEYGQMVVSRWPFIATQVHDITHAKREPRRAIEAEIAAPGGAFRLIATHFGLSLSERRRQARRLVAIARPHAMTTVMLGDFNEWFWPASLRGALRRELPAHTPYATFPSRYPLFRLDRILCWPPQAMQASFVDRSARGVSDHLPVVADIVVYAQPGTLPSGPPDDVSEAGSVSDGLQPAHAACS
jgi:endonuclease/exonuclease/phosphatase family metal-dependent hydrolase